MEYNENIGGRLKEEINMLHYLVVILKHKKMITCVTLAFALIAVVACLFMSPIYKAETKILPPQVSNVSIASQVLNQIGGGTGSSKLLSSSLGLTNPNALYLGMLESWTTYDYIIDRFGLMKLYKAKYKETARAKLKGSVTIESGKDEIISVSMEDKDPQRAAEIANAFIEKLKELTQTLAVTEASKKRLFFEERLREVKDALTKSEEAMKGLQEKTGAVSVDEQAKAVIESIADLRAQIAAKEVEIKVMKTYTEPKNPDLQQAQTALIGMKEQLQTFETKTGEAPDPLVPTGKMPEIGADYARKLREIKYNEELFGLLAQQYELARLDEAKEAVIIQVLDKAQPPAKKAKPKRSLIVAMATFTGFFLAIFAAFFMEYIEKISDDEGNRNMIELIKKYSLFRGDGGLNHNN
jgi:tyrosine-protein kinase Etk/Wzc